MDFESIKKTSDIVLDGIKAEVERQDATITAITLTDAAGHVLRIAKTDYGSLKVLIPAKPKLVKRHALVGEVKGLKVDEVFEHEHQATARRSELEDLDGAELRVEPRDVAEAFDDANTPF